MADRALLQRIISQICKRLSTLPAPNDTGQPQQAGTEQPNGGRNGYGGHCIKRKIVEADSAIEPGIRSLNLGPLIVLTVDEVFGPATAGRSR